MTKVEELARKLGAAVQEDERYLAFAAAKEKNDADTELNGLIGRLNLLQMSYQNESAKETPDDDKLEKWDADFREIYGQIMLNENMRAFEEAKQGVDDMMNYLIQILSLCVNGEDPATCEPAPSDGGGCTGSCSTCGGCG
ncbi:MAG: YlbF family regulator [Clostridia bacterium]|nr:YlbF family regulator [Clostridia bacterium]